MKQFLIVIVFLILFIGVAFGVLSFLSNVGESTVITDTLCDPPCWHKIQPGQTTPWEAVSILQGMQTVGEIAQWGEADEESKIAWIFHRPARDGGGYIYFLDDRVVAISMNPAGSLTLADALEKLGEPDYRWIRYRKTAARRWVEIILVYPTRGFFVQVDIELPFAGESTSVDIEGNSLVGKVVYFDPDQYEYLLNSRTIFRESEQTILERLEPWPGLGSISYEHLLKD
jgi:hypothetical protein